VGEFIGATVRGGVVGGLVGGAGATTVEGDVVSDDAGVTTLGDAVT